MNFSKDMITSPAFLEQSLLSDLPGELIPALWSFSPVSGLPLGKALVPGDHAGWYQKASVGFRVLSKYNIPGRCISISDIQAVFTRRISRSRKQHCEMPR